MKKSRIEIMQERLSSLAVQCDCNGYEPCPDCVTLYEACALYDSLDEKMAKMNNDYLKMMDDMIIGHRKEMEEKSQHNEKEK